MHSGGRIEKASGGEQVIGGNECSGGGEASPGGATTYAISICLCVRSVLVLGVCGRGAAPAVGCRVGGSSGNDHVEGVLGVLREVTTRRVTKTSKKGGESFTYLLFGVTPLNLLL